ncbi:MAG: hypothetical protein M1409_06385, partial [Actinobacteria bacterium]|nr:hypothetical protein [Actinomycetota bacterium]
MKVTASKGWLDNDVKEYNPERESIVQKAVREAAKIAEEIENGVFGLLLKMFVIMTMRIS